MHFKHSNQTLQNSITHPSVGLSRGKSQKTFPNKSLEHGLNLSRSQQQRLLYCLQYPVPIQVVYKRFISFAIYGQLARRARLYHDTEAVFVLTKSKGGKNRRVLAWILAQRRSAIILRMVASPHWFFNQEQIPIIRINGSSRTKLNYYCNNTSSVG